MTEPVVLSWSGGKDSALALREIRRSADLRVVGLLTTLTEDHDRVSMHGVRRSLLEAQALAVGLPLQVMRIPAAASNESYEDAMLRALGRIAERGVRTIAFGDLHLEDVRTYREDLVARAGLRAIFPLWGRDTTALATDFIDSGFQAVLTCVDTEAIDGSFAGRWFDPTLLSDLPPAADRCGENGEFHTFVVDGPGFGQPISITTAQHVLRDGRFMFCELEPLQRARGTED